MESWTSLGHVIDVDYALLGKVTTPLEGCWLVVGAHHLVDIGHLRHQEWEFFGAGHLQSENLVVVANDVLKSHLDGNQKSDSVVSLEFEIVLTQNCLVSEVAFTN